MSACLLLSQGCSYPFQKSSGMDRFSLSEVNRIAVLPMDKVFVSPDRGKPAFVPGDTLFDPGEMPAEATRELTHVLFHAFQGDERFIIVHERHCMDLMNSLPASELNASQLRMIQAFGKGLNVDAVLYGWFFRYKERVGGKYAVRSPASVAFAFRIFRVADGAILWRTTFDETQQPLSENLLKAGLYSKSGMHWLTVRELAADGLAQKTNELRKLLP